jgi:zinc transport system substrate-binding protein
VFVYLDTPEFSWAQDIATALERDHPDVATVDLFSGMAAGAEDGEHDESSHNEGGDDGGGHDHAGRDPHIWLDPLIAREMVTTLSARLGEIESDSQSTFEENAEQYVDEIETVHAELESVVAETPLNTAVLVGHNSFQYLARRYGIELETPVGISPNATASQQDIGDLLDVIEEHGIETVLYDPFEANASSGEYPRLVEAVFENSEVSNAEPLTPISGTTEQWKENDWGWVEQMTEINIPSLEAALTTN